MKNKLNVILMGILLLVITACGSNAKKSDAYGNFEADEIMISSEIGGKILSNNTDESDLVKKNEILVIIDTTQLQLQKEAAIAQKRIIESNFATINSQIEVLEEEIVNLKREKKRVENLLKDNAIPKKQFDDIVGKIKVVVKKISNVKSQKISLNNQVKAQKIKIKTIEDKISRCFVKSAINGTILKKFHSQGEIIAPGKPLFKIAELEKINLNAYVSGTQLTEFKLGQTVKVLVDKSKSELKEYSGKITFISNKAEFTPKIVQTREQRKSLVYKIEVEVKNDGFLKIGMPGEVIWK